jgi:hypothetical protein
LKIRGKERRSKRYKAEKEEDNDRIKNKEHS